MANPSCERVNAEKIPQNDKVHEHLEWLAAMADPVTGPKMIEEFNRHLCQQAHEEEARKTPQQKREDIQRRQTDCAW
jgi:hypothetical protein